ncbi:hypothetical protein D3C73_515790 [compost metagenome]
MVGDQHRRRLQRPHVLERGDHAALDVARRIARPGVALGEALLDVEQRLPLGIGMRHDQAGVIAARRVELHAVELQHLGHVAARLQQLRIGLVVIDLGMVRAAMVGRHHPGEAVIARLLGVDRYAVPAVLAQQGRRDGGGINRVFLIGGAEAAVDVVIPRQPGPRAPIARLRSHGDKHVSLVAARMGQRRRGDGQGGQENTQADARSIKHENSWRGDESASQNATDRRRPGSGQRRPRGRCA